MTHQETPLQQDMFSDELVDTRTPRQKRKAKAQAKPQQTEMFSQREVAQFGVRPRPQLPLAPKTKLELAIEDHRTEEEIEVARMKAAQALTAPMFAAAGDQPEPKPPEKTILKPQPEAETMRFPSGLELNLIRAEEPGGEVRVQLLGKVELKLWGSRDEEYERAREHHWPRGHRVYPVGDDQLEWWPRTPAGYFLITYSDMGIVEDIAWLDSH